LRYLATALITLLLAVPALSVELFRYRAAAKDGGTLEYVFDADEQNSPNAVTKEKAAEIQFGHGTQQCVRPFAEDLADRNAHHYHGVRMKCVGRFFLGFCSIFIGSHSNHDTYYVLMHDMQFLS
jgi:hypothetical protein